MVEIEDREFRYKSWKSYAKALEIEVKLLQQLLNSQDVMLCYNGVRRRIESGVLKGELI